MKIKYTDGTTRTTANDREVIASMIREDVGVGAVIYGGLVWADEESSRNDDGSNAVAKLYSDDGAEFTGDLEDL